MMSTKTKIVADADVIIHFDKAGRLHDLPTILVEYEFVVLSIVRDEVKCPTREKLDNIADRLGIIRFEDFPATGEMMKEYALLTKKYGRGESACMAYCRFTNNVIGSSNLKDIKNYCASHGITNLTTIDFLYYAVQRGKMTAQEANDFVADVKAKGSKLPNVDFTTYVSPVKL